MVRTTTSGAFLLEASEAGRRLSAIAQSVTSHMVKVVDHYDEIVATHVMMVMWLVTSHIW